MKYPITIIYDNRVNSKIRMVEMIKALLVFVYGVIMWTWHTLIYYSIVVFRWLVFGGDKREFYVEGVSEAPTKTNSEDKVKLVAGIIILIAIAVLLITSIFGCLSASSQTGASSEMSSKLKQESSQSMISNDTVCLEIIPTTVTMPDKTVITIGGGRASTGSMQKDQTNQLSNIENKLDNQQKTSASSSFNMTILIIGMIGIGVILLLIEIGRKLKIVSF
jgi:hypothetical protein